MPRFLEMTESWPTNCFNKFWQKMPKKLINGWWMIPKTGQSLSFSITRLVHLVNWWNETNSTKPMALNGIQWHWEWETQWQRVLPYEWHLVISRSHFTPLIEMHLLLRSFQASKRDNILGFHFYEQSDSNPGLPNLQITRQPLCLTPLSRIIFKN